MPHLRLIATYPRHGYPRRMAQPNPEERRSDVAAQFTADFGIPITPEGMDRARQRLQEAETRRTPERVAAWRRQLGMDHGDSTTAA